MLASGCASAKTNTPPRSGPVQGVDSSALTSPETKGSSRRLPRSVTKALGRGRLRPKKLRMAKAVSRALMAIRSGRDWKSTPQRHCKREVANPKLQKKATDPAAKSAARAEENTAELQIIRSISYAD